MEMTTSSADTQKLHAGSNHPFGRITVATHDAVGQRAVINADANGCSVFPADGKERNKAVAYLLDFGGILLVGVSQLVECLEAVDIVTGIDAHLFDCRGCHVGCTRVEMDVGNQRRRVARVAQPLADNAQVMRFAFALCRKTDIFRAGLNQADGLPDGSLRIHCRNVCHRLDADGVVSS